MANVVKNYLEHLASLLKSKKILNVLLLILLSATFLAGKIYDNNFVLKSFLVLFVLTFLIQNFLLLKKCYLLYIFRLILFFLIGFQIVWVVQLKTTEREKKLGSTRELDERFGDRMRSNVQGEDMIGLWKDETLYHVLFSTDSVGRRISETQTPTDTLSELPLKHAIFYGCSFTFGEGLSYSSTFPALFEQRHPDFKSYNYGVDGWGPQQSALLFDSRVNTINRSTIEEPNGFVLYTFISDHLERVYGGSLYFTWAPFSTPDVFVENDSLIVKPRNKSRLFLSRILNNVGLTRLLHINIQYPKTELFYKRFADILNYSAKKYWEMNPSGRFYVGVYPNYPECDLTWIQYLDPKIKVLQPEVPADIKQNRDKYHIPHDGHPTEALNVYYVEKISELMGLE
jgi:hypothetical protein